MMATAGCSLDLESFTRRTLCGRIPLMRFGGGNLLDQQPPCPGCEAVFKRRVGELMEQARASKWYANGGAS